MRLFTENPLEKSDGTKTHRDGVTVRRPFQNPRRVCAALIRRNPPVSAIV